MGTARSMWTWTSQLLLPPNWSHPLGADLAEVPCGHGNKQESHGQCHRNQAQVNAGSAYSKTPTTSRW